MNQTAAAIEAFAELTIRRLKGELPQAERAQLEALEDQLRDEIDGARPAPRKIENPSAAPVGRTSMPVKPAQVVVTRSSDESTRIEPSITPARPANVRRSNTPPPAPPPPAPRSKEPASAAQVAERLSLNSKDKSKLNEIDAKDLQVSHYTPSAAPPFMEDYYDEAMAPDPALVGLRPSVVRSLGDGPLPEVKTLFGVSRVLAAEPPEHATEPPEEEALVSHADAEDESTQFASSPPPVRAPVQRPSAQPPRPSAEPARPSAEPPRRPAPTGERPLGAVAAAVHLQAGGSKKGDVLRFEPDGPGITLRTATGDELIETAAIFVIFFAPPKGGQPAPAQGTRIAVKMTNDREIVGASPDYAPGAGAMTLIPDDRRNVDRIWIPAWSVAEIRFA